MIANLLHIAGVNHVITIDLHASQMQGFFKCPVDNLVAEPLLARWIKQNVPNWKEGVVVSKNPGGTKRVTSLADALKLSFGIVTTDRRRRRIDYSGYFSMTESTIFDNIQPHPQPPPPQPQPEPQQDSSDTSDKETETETETETEKNHSRRPLSRSNSTAKKAARKHHGRHRVNGSSEIPSSPLAKASRAKESGSNESSPSRLSRSSTAPIQPQTSEDSDTDGFIDGVCKVYPTSNWY